MSEYLLAYGKPRITGGQILCIGHLESLADEGILGEPSLHLETSHYRFPTLNISKSKRLYDDQFKQDSNLRKIIEEYGKETKKSDISIIRAKVLDMEKLLERLPLMKERFDKRNSNMHLQIYDRIEE